MRARLTLAARVLLVAVLMGIAFVFIGHQRGGGKATMAVVEKTAVAEPRPPQSAPARTAAADAVAPCLDDEALIVPVRGVARSALVDTFTDARSEGRLHDAIDIMAPTGTPVIAAAAGKVEKLFQSTAGGNTIYVRSRDRRAIHYYAHLDSYAPDLHEGQTIAQGALIGFVGYTGNANPAAPHLHFGLTATTPERKWSDDGTTLNPYPYLATASPRQRRCESSAKRAVGKQLPPS